MNRQEGKAHLMAQGMPAEVAEAHMDLVDAVSTLVTLQGPEEAIEACKHAALTVLVALGHAEWILPEDQGEPN